MIYNTYLSRERGTPFSHILCWVDGSDAACRAAQQAAHLARNLSARLSFMAVGHELQHDSGFEAYARIENVSEPIPPIVENEARICLDQAMSIAAKVGVHDAARLVQTGNPIAALCYAAREWEADLVVIGRHHPSPLKRWFGRSIADTFAQRCKFAVLSAG